MAWWHNAAVYQVYPHSFNASNNDRDFDLKGVTLKLDYLAELGINAIWLSPFYPSPRHDGGYDISDPRDVAAELGGLSAFDDLLEQATLRGIKIIVDLVPNHFSIEHPWFQEAIASGPNSKERKRFHFLSGKGLNGELPPNNWISVFGGSAWSRIVEPNGTSGQWYLHLFDKSQPDLNWTNREISADFEKTLRFWLDRGVSGFRVDVALGLFKDMSYADDPNPQARVDAIRLDLFDPTDLAKSEEIRSWLKDSPIFDRSEVHQVYQNWRKIFAEYDRQILGVAEAWAYPASRAMAYANSLGSVFNFDFMVVDFDSTHVANTIHLILDSAIKYQANPTWVLSNHDASRVVSRMGGGQTGLNRARALAMLAHFLPGSVYIYQGEELGIEDATVAEQDRKDPIWESSGKTQIGRDGARAPIPWDVVPDQMSDPSSTLGMYQELLKLRATHSAWQEPIQETTWQLDGDLLTVSRGNLVSCYVNFGSSPFELNISELERVLVSSVPLPKGFLPPNGAVIVQKLVA